MSFQRVWRLRILKFPYFGGSRVQRKLLPVVQLSTKANNIKKPVRYTSIKKAKPKTIADIAKILEQKTKENKDKEQSIAAISTKPAAPNQYNAATDSAKNISPTSKASSIILDKEPARDLSDRDLSDREAVAKDAPKKSARTKAVASCDVLQETDVISSYETHASESKQGFDVAKYTPELVARTEIVQVYNTANSKIMAVLSTHADDEKTVLKQIEVVEDVLFSSDSTIDCHYTLHIATAEAAPLMSSELPTFPEVPTEEILATLYATHKTSTVSDVSPETADKSDVVETVSPLGNEIENVVSVENEVVDGDASSFISLKEPDVLRTEVLGQKMWTDKVEESSESRLDPIQRLFLDKIREYSSKSKSCGGLVDAGPEYEKAFNEELAKLQRLYGGGDLTKFPEFIFSETSLDEDSSK